MASLEEQLASVVKQRLATPVPQPEQVLEHLDRQEQELAEYSESPEENSRTLEKLNFYRTRFGVSTDIKNDRLIELLAENEFLPDRPVVEDERSLGAIIQNTLQAIDAKYCGWTDTRAGAAIFIALGATLMCLAFLPGGLARLESYEAGYQACKIKADVGVPCE
jgi:hypothetical protein